MHDKILIPVALDQETLVDRHLAAARHLLTPGGEIFLLTVLENIPGFVTEFVDLKPENHLRAKVEERLRGVAAGDPAVRCAVVTGKPGVEIARFAEAEGVDLIVMGSHEPGAQDIFLGSTASRVVRRAGCSVYVLR